MSITVEIDEALLRAAEAATNIHNPDELVRAALATLGKVPRSKSESGGLAGTEKMRASLPPATKEDREHCEDYDREREWERGSVPTAGKATLAELLACADTLPDLSNAEFAAWERELAHPIPARDPWKS